MKVDIEDAAPHLFSSPTDQTSSFSKAVPSPWSIFLLLAAFAITLPLNREALPIALGVLLCGILSCALLVPWGLKEQSLVCAAAGASYFLAACSGHLVRSPEDIPYDLLILTISSVVSLVGVSRQQSQRARFTAQTQTLQQQMQEAEARQEFSHELTAVLDGSQLLPPLTSVVQRLCPSEGLLLALWDPTSKEFELWTQTDAALHKRQFPLEPALTKEILQIGWPVFIEDVAHPPVPALLFATLAHFGYVSLFVTPLRAAHRVVGTLIVGWREPHASLTRHEEELLQLIADQTVQPLSNIRFHQEQERHLNESESLRRIGQKIAATLDLQDILALVTKEGARLVACESSILTWSTTDNMIEVAGVYGLPESWKAERLSFADSVTELVIQERRAIRMEDVQEKNLPLTQQLAHFGQAQPRSFLAVPLWREGQPMGALIVLSTASRSFALEDECILHALADHAVLAIHKAQLYEQLQGVLRREQETGKQQAAFFASASHELRTPLNIILGYIDLVREGVVGQVDAEAAETLDRVRSSAQHMISLVNDLLDLARIERAEFQLHPAVVDLEELLAEICAVWEKPITEKGLSFQRVGASFFPPLVTDKARLRQMLDNLLGNALKFTHTGHITMGARVLEHNIEIWVEDTGIGIDPLYHEKIFDEFQQVEHTSVTQLEGFGLGLAVCKKIARLLQGDIHLESIAGRGSTFTISLVRQHSS